MRSMVLFAQGDVSLELWIMRGGLQEWKMAEYPYLVDLSSEEWRTRVHQLVYPRRKCGQVSKPLGRYPVTISIRNL